MKTDRYNYAPIIERKPIRWPNSARVALIVAPNIESFHIDKTIPGSVSSYLPDVTNYALRDYGSRVGVFRMMEVLDKHGVRATVLLNSDVCAHHPQIIAEGNKRGWGWLGHGVTNIIRITQYKPEEERGVIRQIRDTIAAATGKGPRGWLGPGGGDESVDTLDHLAAEGYDYVCD
jgi:polysaccharide deacetylase